MKKTVISFLSLAFLACSLQSPAAAEAKKKQAREPDSVYVEKKEDRKQQRSSSGFFDFLPFIGGRKAKVAPEDLKPSPPPQESKPVLQKKELAQLRIVAEQWILGTEYAEPTTRQGDSGKSYRDYIVFSDEYEAKVLRGESEENPFIGHIYIQGDYFKTASHDSPEEASSDFKFTHQSREFRVIFDRIKKWEYSDKPGDEPFRFVERWEFNSLQSRPVADMSEILSTPDPPMEEMEEAPAPQPENPEPESE
jgi:hypothetical protein